MWYFQDFFVLLLWTVEFSAGSSILSGSLPAKLLMNRGSVRSAVFATCSSIPPNNCRLETENWLLHFLLETFFDFFLPHWSSYAFVFMFCGNCFSFVIFLSFEGQNFIWDDLNFAHVFLNLHLLVIGQSQAFWGFIPTTGSALDA